jgi:excinuclease ABC subunit B
MRKAIDETDRRRKIQSEYNLRHGITPQTIKKKIREGVGDMFDGALSAYKLQGMKDKTAEQLKLFSEKPNRIQEEIIKLKVKMKKLSSELEFEAAADVRDEIRRLEILELQVREGSVTEKTPEIVPEVIPTPNET